MPNPVIDFLKAVLRRQRRARVLHAVVWGLLLGSLFSLALAFAWPGTVWPWLALAAGPLGGALAGWRRPGWYDAARAVDECFQLPDHMVTALEFAGAAMPTDFQCHQLRDAERRLDGRQPVEVVPVRLPRFAPVAGLAFVGAVVVLLAPLLVPPAVAVAPDPLAEVLAEAETLEEQARELEAAAGELDSPELKKLAELMRQKVEEMRQPGVELKEAMAKVSQMQAELAKQMKELQDVPLVDEQLKNLGQAMQGAKQLDSAGQALQKGEHHKAAKELDQLNEPKMDKKEAQATAEQMRQVAKEMKSKKLDSLGGAADQMADGVQGNKKKFQAGARSLAKEVRQQERRRRVYELMAKEQKRLSDCKSRCANQIRNLLSRNQNNPSQSQQQQQQQAGGKQSPLGQANKGNVAKKREEVKGKAGDGPSEIEVEEDDPQRQGPAKRPDKDLFQKYRRISEAALDNEPIPLGHRQAIRRYFELIRPQGEEPEKNSQGGSRP